MTKKIKFATKPLKYIQTYYYWSPEGYYGSSWDNGSVDFRLLRLYRVFLKEKYAKRAYKFVKEFIRSNPERLNYLTSEPDQGTEVWYGSRMNGDSNDPIPINYDINSGFHQDKLDNFRLYRTKKDVINASNLINLAVETEYKRQKYKFITEEPAHGTPVYYPDFDNCDPSKFGVACIHYNSNKIWHVVLFRCGVLFLKEEDAERASKKMMQQINPLVMRT